ncbi:autotransporter YapF [Yersinia similis]|uniref:autotransporter YapF n=1 Tax=Yersinia similis TaxID=367190 RepID=UPI0011A01671|nr:autotransporter YapF [Yersinia similis]
MSNHKIWRLSAVAVALLISGNSYADQTFHFAQQPHNTGDHTVIAAPEVNNFSLADLTANAEGQAVDATNAGALSLRVEPTQGDAQANGVLVTSGTFTNQAHGSITVSASSQDQHAVASGLQATDAYWSTLRNQGSISATSNSLHGSAEAYGIQAGLAFSDAAGDHYGDHMMLSNEGVMQVSATAEQDAFASGIYTNAGNGVVNNGRLDVSAHASAGDARATGLHTLSANPGVDPDPWNPANPTHLMSNNGSLSVTASGNNATASAISTEGEGVYIYNNGTLIVDAFSDSAQGSASAYGIHVLNGSATINSSGRILATATGGSQQQAYEVMADGSVVNIERYTLALGNETPWAVSNGGSIVLGNGTQGADLVLMAGQASEGFAYGKEYSLNNLAYDTTTGQQSTVGGAIAGLYGITPDIKVIYSGGGSSSLGSAALVYAPDVSHAGVSALAQRSSMEQASNIISSQLHGQLVGNAGCNQKLESADSCVFITPYAGEYRRDPVTSGYSGQRYGVLLGQNQHFGDFQLGWHGGYESASTDFNGTSVGRKEEINTLMLGVQGGMKLSESLFIAATSTWFSSDTDYSDSNTYYGVGSQSGSYDSSGLYTDISVGNSWQLNRNYAMTPMVGLTHIWQQRDGYTVSSNNSNYDLIDTRYSSYSDHAVALHAGVRLDGRYPLTNETLLKPFFNVGLQQMLYGDEITIDQSIPNSQVVGVSTKDKNTQGTFDLGMALVSDNGVSASLQLSGMVNSDRQDFTGWANLGWAF